MSSLVSTLDLAVEVLGIGIVMVLGILMIIYLYRD